MYTKKILEKVYLKSFEEIMGSLDKKKPVPRLLVLKTKTLVRLIGLPEEKCDWVENSLDKLPWQESGGRVSFKLKT